ncbi:MAG TPA: hypothetical protein VGE01_06760, partial [Fimbriimonas sp.]
RGIGEVKSRAIIESYKKIRDNLPEGSPGEWYTIYPPFERGFGGHSDKWQYMNASVTPIVAGELAHGAFQHGEEAYGADILNRLVDLGRRFDNQFHCSYTGCLPAAPERQFETVDLSTFINSSLGGAGGGDRVHEDSNSFDSSAVAASPPPSPQGEGANQHPLPMGEGRVRGRQDVASDSFERRTVAASPPSSPQGEGALAAWPNGDNDLHELPTGEQTFSDVPFLVPEQGAIGLSERDGFAQRVEIPLHASRLTPHALYFFHTVSGGNGPVGTVTLKFADGTQHRRNVIRNRDIVHWWMPELPGVHGRRTLEIGWKGRNEVLPYVGVCVWGLDNPHPEKELRSIVLEAAPEGAVWHVIGLTLSDHEAWFPTSPISFGIPNGWGAAAVVYALVEGLAGVVDKATAFDRVELSPRWSAAGEDEADVTVHYPASDGYVSYRYRHDPGAKTIRIELTGSGEGGELSVLLPGGGYASRQLDSLSPQVVELSYG